MAVGPGARDKDGGLIPMALSIGDAVLLPEYGGQVVKVSPPGAPSPSTERLTKKTWPHSQPQVQFLPISSALLAGVLTSARLVSTMVSTGRRGRVLPVP